MASFVSHAQNREDVLLWRALNDVERGAISTLVPLSRSGFRDLCILPAWLVRDQYGARTNAVRSATDRASPGH